MQTLPPAARARAHAASCSAALLLASLAAVVAHAGTPAPSAAPSQPAASGRSAAALYRRECGDCHLAYAPRLMPAPDWRRIVGALERHFGVDATLEPAETTAIARWLEAGAGRPRGPAARDAAVPSALPRISTSAWFRHEHDEIGAATWKRVAIGSPARCEACHTDAAQGRFDEDAVRIPR